MPGRRSDTLARGGSEPEEGRTQFEDRPTENGLAVIAEVGPIERTQPRMVIPSLAPLADTPLPEGLSVSLDLVVERLVSVRLKRTRTVIGRGDDVDVRIDDAKASRRHAIIYYTGKEFRVRDESSTNGTILNGSRVVEYALRDGDELLIGGTVIRFRTAGH